ncbi:MAG: 3-phosphoshikimate 1-carboxyvinyltransferase [Planctomycetes bacterium]|nr:3-phosphoshikimate 1-carboxyvinyltransferase [Planctomycetota bacterium]
MSLRIPRLASTVRRTWNVPGSKSITNRALLLAALAEGTSVVENVLASDDTQRMREGLEALGIAIRDGGPGQLIIDGGRSRLRAPAQPIFVGNSGTTVRFLAAAAVLVPGQVTFVGDEAMAKRPIADLVEGLRQLGVQVDCASGCPPLTVHGGRLAGGRIRLRADKSSQYLTALLLVAGLGEAPLDIELVGTLVSRPYVEMTRRMVADFGGLIEDARTGFRARRCAAYRARGYRVEPDASSASYPFALAALGHDITVPDLGTRSLQGDHAFVELLKRMGAQVEAGAVITRVVGVGDLAGIEADMHHISDTVMTLAAIAPLADGPTTIRNVANIRIKECDRLAAMVAELRKLGQEVEHGDDWLRVIPRPITPATVHCYRDHRIAMSFGVLGAATGAVTVDDPGCVAKTYPGFWDDLRACYGTGQWAR